MVENSKPQRIEIIDLLRFLAAVLVLLFHWTFYGNVTHELKVNPCPPLGPWCKYGLLGVHLFFIISGFVIFMSVSKSNATRFFASRAVRLFPAFWFCCAATALFTALVGGSRSISWKEFLANMTMVFQPFAHVRTVDDSYWSLFVELKFYFFVGLLLFFKRLDSAEYALLVWLFITITSVWFPNKIVSWCFVTQYAPFFVAGAIFFLIFEKGMNLFRTGMLLLSYTLCVYVAIEISYERNFSLDPWICIAVVTLWFLMFVLISKRRTGIFGRINWTILGSISYPLYLLHQNLGYILINLFSRWINIYILFYIMIVFMVFSAWMINIWVERPISKFLRSILPMKISTSAQIPPKYMSPPS